MSQTKVTDNLRNTTQLDGAKITTGTIPIARIADDAITLAKMAPGTDGQILTYDASGNPVAVGPGTDGQVLTSTGAGSPPAFEAIPAGGVDGISSSADATAITITSDEKVGIGTTAPQRILSVGTHGTGNSEISMGASTSGQSGILFGDATNAVAVGYIQYQHNDNHFRIATNDAERVRIHNNGVVACACGIALGISTANTASNVMNDYEEGSWTPAWIPTSGSWSGTFNGARYIKIGKLCWAAFTFTASSAASGTKMNGLSGLPFSSASNGVRAPATYALHQVGLTDYLLSARVQFNGTQIDCSLGRQGTGGQSEFYPSHTHASSQVQMQVCYETT